MSTSSVQNPVMPPPSSANPVGAGGDPAWGDFGFIQAAVAPLLGLGLASSDVGGPAAARPAAPLPETPGMPTATPTTAMQRPSGYGGTAPTESVPGSMASVPRDPASMCVIPQDDPVIDGLLASLRGAPSGTAPAVAIPSTLALPDSRMGLAALQSNEIDSGLANFFSGGGFGTMPSGSAPPLGQNSPSTPQAATTSTPPIYVHPSAPTASPPAAQANGAEPFSALELKSIRDDFPILHQTVNGHPLAWLDNAATTQKPRAVMQALEQFYARDNSNIHRAAHALAARATDAYEAARVTVQQFIKAKDAKEIVFVRGTTEAINLVAQSYGRANFKPGDEILVTTMEHHANIVPWQMVCAQTGAVLRAIPISDVGEVDMLAYAKMLSPKTKFVSITHVSNVLGTVNPVQQMTAMARAVGARVLIDGAQSVAHEPVNVCEIGCDFFVFSGHKIFAPTGVGALYARYELLESMPPWQGGGNMIDEVTFAHTTYAPPPAKFEAGTATLGDAVGLGAALDYVNRIGLLRAAAHEQALLHAATQGLSQIPGLRIYGNSAHKAAVVSFLIDGIPADAIGKELNKVGIAVRTGHHCAQPTMQRYGVRNMVRPSFALYNTFEEVERLVRAVQRVRFGQRD